MQTHTPALLPVLEVCDVSRWYGRFAALDGVDMVFHAGEVHGLCGENGAGKSTLVKILGGLVAPTQGHVRVDGMRLTPGQRTNPGLVSIVHQELSIIPDLSVLDNVLLGDDALGQWLPRRRYRAQVRQQLDQLSLSHVDLDWMAQRLSLAERQLVEIARGVSRQARVLVLDEPTASLSDYEIARVFAAVRWLRAQGTAIVFISHRLSEIFTLTDQVTVLRNGRKVLTDRTAHLNRDMLITAMIGRRLRQRERRTPAAQTAATARVQCQDLHVPGRIQPMALTIAQGEIVAVVGQIGSGADAVVQALAGQCPDLRGQVQVDGRSVLLRTPAAAVTAGIAYVSEDRAGKGVFLDATIQSNLSASILGRLQRFGILDLQAERTCTSALAVRFTLDSQRLLDEAHLLSGGNQQKVAIAKAVAIQPRVLVLNEPTRGVDVGARAEIYRQLNLLAEDGMSVLFFSTDLEEVLELADRVLTVFRGRIVHDHRIEAVDMERLLEDILQGPQGLAA